MLESVIRRLELAPTSFFENLEFIDLPLEICLVVEALPQLECSSFVTSRWLFSQASFSFFFTFNASLTMSEFIDVIGQRSQFIFVARQDSEQLYVPLVWQYHVS